MNVSSDHPSFSQMQARPPRQRLGWVMLALAALAILTPLLKEEYHGERLGVLLVATALLEFLHAFRRTRLADQRAAWLSAAITLFMGLLLLNSALVKGTALVWLFAGWFGLDGVRHLLVSMRQKGSLARLYCLVAGVGNLLVATGLFVFRGQEMPWTLAVATTLRIVGTAINIIIAPVISAEGAGADTLEQLELPDNPEAQQLAEAITRQEIDRQPIDRGWIIGFILTLFAIHLGRMGFDRSALGIMSPVLAVLGDIAMGLLIAFVFVLPVRLFSQRLTLGLERRGWAWYLDVDSAKRGWLRRGVGVVLQRRLRTAIRLRQMRVSLGSALGRALQIGLPAAAIIAAIAPILGMSWYFNTENWASGAWDSWAAHRSDDWREAMVQAVLAAQPETDPAKVFAIRPAGVESGDFAFLVIGDTGEGDASQHSLRAAYLAAVQQPAVKFVIISSDVVYPTGAMRDYERCFWLPFMGTTKPVYAIPGNHDWYDALEGFVATFFEPGAARLAMRARVEVDKRITATTDQQIEALIAQVGRLRREYGVPTQLQQAPYFQFQTDQFALFAIDTGVVKQMDPIQREWLRKALEAAKGKTKMALLGHPLYAGGRYMAEDIPEFAALHDLLRQHDVAIVMGGDTHDLEFYREERPGGAAAMLHFVNGGGGAYLSYGTSLDWPETPATPEWAYFPTKANVMAKIEATTPTWKWPAWWWTKRTGGWPFSAEFLSAAFDANVAPFYQSFMVIHVERSKGRIRLVPHGVHGPLKWSDLDRSTDLPGGEELVEWVVPLR